MKVRVSLKPLQNARWETNPLSGLRYLVAPMPSDRDAELQRECSDVMGNVNTHLFASRVCTEFLKGWEGFVLPDGTPAPFNAENLKEFLTWHGQTEAQFVVRKTRAFAHFVSEEVEEGKKG